MVSMVFGELYISPSLRGDERNIGGHKKRRGIRKMLEKKKHSCPRYDSLTRIEGGTEELPEMLLTAHGNPNRSPLPFDSLITGICFQITTAARVNFCETLTNFRAGLSVLMTPTRVFVPFASSCPEREAGLARTIVLLWR
jgi:hypothetical protein